MTCLKNNPRHIYFTKNNENFTECKTVYFMNLASEFSYREHDEDTPKKREKDGLAVHLEEKEKCNQYEEEYTAILAEKNPKKQKDKKQTFASKLKEELKYKGKMKFILSTSSFADYIHWLEVDGGKKPNFFDVLK